MASPSSIHSREYRALLELLRGARHRSGLSQTDLGERLLRTQSWVSKVEIGERRIDLEELRQVCEALDIDLVRFVKGWLRSI